MKKSVYLKRINLYYQYMLNVNLDKLIMYLSNTNTQINNLGTVYLDKIIKKNLSLR